MNITSNIVLAGRNLSKCCNWRGWLPPEPCHWARCREGRPRWWAHCKDSLPTTRSPPSRRPEVCRVSHFQVTIATVCLCRPWHAEREDAAEKRRLRELQPSGWTQDYEQSSSIVPIVARCGNYAFSFRMTHTLTFLFCRFEMYCVCETDAQRETLHTRNICLICEVLKDAFCGGSSLSGPPSPSSACWQ